MAVKWILRCLRGTTNQALCFGGSKIVIRGSCPKCRKMLKNESAQNWLKPKQPDRAHPLDSSATNGSKNGRRMRKL